MPTIETLAAQVERQLLGADLLNLIDSHFELKEPCDILFNSYWMIPEVREILTLPPINNEVNKKANNESELLRAQGNRLYKERKFEKALHAYNYAILAAPHPQNVDHDSDIINLSADELPKSIGVHECLAIAYANRSALLFEMENYIEANYDIHRALKYGYPKSKSPKLIERKQKCLATLDRINAEAKMVEETKPPDAKANLPNLSKSQKKKNRRKNKNQNDLVREDSLAKKEKLPKFHHLFYTGPENVPQCSNDNDSSTGYNSAIYVGFSQKKGRHLVATRDIDPGEIIHVETAKCSLVKIDSKLRSYCTHCLRRAPLALPCSKCSLVVYCSEECRKTGSQHHLKICLVLPLLVSLQLDVEVYLAFKYFSQFTLRDIENHVEDILTDDIDLHYNNKDNIKKPFLKQTNNYKSFYYLEGNVDAKPTAVLKEVAANAIIVLRLLMKLTHFSSEAFQDLYIVSPEEAWIKLLGGQIMLMILNFQCNDHCIKEMKLNNENLLMSQSQEVGYGVYPLLSFINHSCAPNAFNSNYGNTKFLYSISLISKGEEIADCYGERFVSHSLTERRSNLEKVYNFTCDCIACVNYWPLFEQISKEIKLKCFQCKKPLNHSIGKCSNCSNSNKNSKSKVTEVNVKNISEIVTKSTVEYNIAVSQLSKCKISKELIDNVKTFIKTFDKHVVLPSQLYVQAQEMLGKYFDSLGSQVLSQ